MTKTYRTEFLYIDGEYGNEFVLDRPTVKSKCEVYGKLGFTGFESLITSTMFFNNSSRTFTLTPITDQSINVYINGNYFSKMVEDSVIIPDASDLYYIYYEETGILKASTTSFDKQKNIVAPVATILWNDTEKFGIIISDERNPNYVDIVSNTFFNRAISYHKVGLETII